MTKSEYFDLLEKTSLEGGFPSIDLYCTGPGSCRYRSLNGLGCVVGLLIPDELYSPGMEGIGISDLVKRCRELISHIPSGLTLGQLHRLQRLHDTIGQHLYETTGVNKLYWSHEDFMVGVREIFNMEASNAV
jgi:hypothetical protein